MTREKNASKSTKSGYYFIKYKTVVISPSLPTIAKNADESMAISDVKPPAATQRWTKIFLGYISLGYFY